MNDSSPRAPVFDGEWLDELAAATAGARRGAARFRELYLERRLESVVRTVNGGDAALEIRTEGVVARWEYPSRTFLAARDGIAAGTVRDVLSLPGPAPRPRGRELVAEIDPPRGFTEWSRRLAASRPDAGLEIRLLLRRSAVVRPSGWTPVDRPALVRIRSLEPGGAGLLAVWGHPRLAEWVGRILAPPPARSFTPHPGARLPVLLTDGTAGVLVHELIGHLLESDLAAAGLSPLRTLGGAEICPPSVGIVDDPTRFDLPGGFTADDEGVRARPLSLVHRGILRGFICDSRGSVALRQPAGRGRRASWEHPPLARMSNLIMEPGREDPAAIEHGLRQGLVVTRLGGATVDPGSGRVILKVEDGFEVRNGRRRRRLAPLHLVGAVLPLLTHMDPAVGNDPQPEWRLGWCVKNGVPIPTGSEAPSVLLHGLEVL